MQTKYEEFELGDYKIVLAERLDGKCDGDLYCDAGFSDAHLTGDTYATRQEAIFNLCHQLRNRLLEVREQLNALCTKEGVEL